MVIEDEFGGLTYTQGNLSFLMPCAPVLNEPFAGQLNAEIKAKYRNKQLAVWEQILTDGEKFSVVPNWSASILPFWVEADSYTVTIFFNGV
jgi:hypothetical protein